MTLILSLPAAVAVGGSIVSVPAPNGTDDTNDLQSALDNCMTNYPQGCTIQLAPGTYLSKQLIAENFRGTVQGMGMDVTTIEVLAPLEVTISDQNVQNNPPSRTNKWPVLLTFLSGDITVEDITFKVSAYSPTTSWWYGGAGPGQTWLEGFVGAIGSSANLLVHGRDDFFQSHRRWEHPHWDFSRGRQPLCAARERLAATAAVVCSRGVTWG